MKTIFPGKLPHSISFNLTETGRKILKNKSFERSISQGDLLEVVIRKHAAVIEPPSSFFTRTSAVGGRPSFFFGKNRGTTTALYITPKAKDLLDNNAKRLNMSRGDFVELLLRTELIN